MKRALAFALLMAGSPLDAGEIVQKPLDEFVIYNIPVAFQSGNTTVSFPRRSRASTRSRWRCRNSPTRISSSRSRREISTSPSARSRKTPKTISPSSTTGRLMSCISSASEKPFYSVTFFQGGNTRAAARPVVPERLLSLWTKRRRIHFSRRTTRTRWLASSTPRPTPRTTTIISVVTRDVWRFEEEDTLIFRIDLENTSDSTIYYKPQDLAVRLEDRIYTQSLADASGVMPPKSTTPAFFAITGNGSGGRNNLAPDNKWNVLVVRVDAAARRTTNERAQNLDGTVSETRGAARSFPLVGRNLSRFHPDAADTAAEAGQHARPSQATQAKSYSFQEDIQPPLADRGHAVSARVRQDRARHAHSQAAATHSADDLRHQGAIRQRMVLPYGRLLRCELVNTVDSTNIDTPIIGLVIEDIWNDGRVIIPAGTEVHGVAQKSPVRERIGSDRQWFLVFQDGRELPISGSVLDYAPRRIPIRGRNRMAPRACADSS